MLKSLICLLFGHDFEFKFKLNIDLENQNISEIHLTQPVRCRRCFKDIEVDAEIRQLE